MEIDIKKIKDGEMNGEIVWICHYNRPDMNKKPLRNIPPTKCIVMDNSETKKTIYYSASHFRPINEKGGMTSQAYSPVDNTGYRSLHGNPVHVFTNEKQCVESWREQISRHIIVLDSLIESAAKHWQLEKDTLLASLR